MFGFTSESANGARLFFASHHSILFGADCKIGNMNEKKDIYLKK